MTKEMLLEDHYIDDYVDDHVDREIESCFSASSPNNFFVFAGAGSGKTRSLINTLNFLDKEQGEKLLMKGKQILLPTQKMKKWLEIQHWRTVGSWKMKFI